MRNIIFHRRHFACGIFTQKKSTDREDITVLFLEVLDCKYYKLQDNYTIRNKKLQQKKFANYYTLRQKERMKNMKNTKKLVAIVLTLTLLCGLFVMPSMADEEPEEATTVETIEPALEEQEETTEQEIEEEEATEQEEGVEEEAEEQGEALDQEEVEEPEEPEEPEGEEKYYFSYNHVWEDDDYIYELDAEDPSDPDFRLILTKTCKNCGMSDLDELTQGQVLSRFGINVKEK